MSWTYNPFTSKLDYYEAGGTTDLSGYVPYVGATGTVNLGLHNLSAGSIYASGSVGIGISTPGKNLEIAQAGTNTFAAMALTGYNDQEAYDPHIILRKSHTDTLGSLVTTPNATELGAIYFHGVNQNSGFQQGFHILARQAGAAGTTYIGTNVYFETMNDNGQNDDQLVLTHDGDVGVGIYPSSKLHLVTSKTEGHEAFRINQQDDDKAFIDYRGTITADANNNISSWTNAVLDGFVKVEIQGVEKWMAYYQPPTS